MKSKKIQPTTAIGIVFLLPAVIVIMFTLLGPFIWNIVLSFQEWNGFLGQEWIGFSNYIEAFQDNYVRESLYNSFFLGIISTIGAVIIGLILAILVFQLGNLEGSIYRLIIFTPVMLPLAVIGLLFTFIYNPDMGLLNQFLGAIGLESLQKAWLGNPDTVMWAITFVGIWRMAGLTMLLCMASMVSIPKELFEAAKMDGMGYIRQSYYVIIPLIKPMIQLSSVFTLIICLKTYDLVFVMTRGGPGTESQTLPIYLIDSAFTYGKFGYSATLGVIFTVLGLGVIFLIQKLLKGEQYEF